MLPEPENHASVEGIEYSPGGLDSEIAWILEDSGTTPEEADYVDLDREELVLYRGEIDTTLDEIRNEDGGLERDFPVYFTESRDEAVNTYAAGKKEARKKVDTHRIGEIRGPERYLIEVRVPFDSVGYVDRDTEREIELEPDSDHGMEPETLYYMHSFRGTAEFAATEVPRDWIERIEEL